MSDQEYENTSNTSRTSKKGDEAFAKAKSGRRVFFTELTSTKFKDAESPISPTSIFG